MIPRTFNLAGGKKTKRFWKENCTSLKVTFKTALNVMLKVNPFQEKQLSALVKHGVRGLAEYQVVTSRVIMVYK